MQLKKLNFCFWQANGLISPWYEAFNFDTCLHSQFEFCASEEPAKKTMVTNHTRTCCLAGSLPACLVLEESETRKLPNLRLLISWSSSLCAISCREINDKWKPSFRSIKEQLILLDCNSPSVYDGKQSNVALWHATSRNWEDLWIDVQWLCIESFRDLLRSGFTVIGNSQPLY